MMNPRVYAFGLGDHIGLSFLCFLRLFAAKFPCTEGRAIAAKTHKRHRNQTPIPR